MSDSHLSLPDSMPVAPSSNENILLAAKGGGILFVGRLFEFASRFVFGIVVARSLGADGFGLYTLGVTTSILLAAVARLGLSEGLVRFIPPALRVHDESRVWGVLQVGLSLPVILGIMLAVALFGFSDLVAERLLNQPSAAPILRWVSLAIPFLAAGRVLLAASRAFQRMDYQVYADSILFNVSRLVLTGLFLAMGLKVGGALAAYALAWLSVDVMLLFVLNRLFPLLRPLSEGHRNARALLSFSAPVCLTQVIVQLRSTFGLVLLGIFGTIGSVGAYSVAISIQAVGGMLLVAADLVAKPIISDVYHRGEMVQLQRLYQTLTRWATSFLLPYFITVVLLAEPILAIFGKDYEAGVPVLVIVSVGTLVSAVTGLCDAVIIMTGHPKLSLANTLLAVATTVSLNAILIPTYGLVGAAVATALSSIAVNVIRMVQVYWLVKFWPWNLEFVKPFVAGLAGLGTGLLVRSQIPANRSLLYLLLDIAILWLVYIAATLLLGLSAEDRFVLSRTKRRFSTAFAWRKATL